MGERKEPTQEVQMLHSRYQATATPPESRSAHQLIQDLIGRPFESHRADWECFVKDVVRLPLCYVDGVHKVIANGRWKAKLDPVAFIRKTAQTAAFASLGLAEQKRDRTKTYVGRAVDPEQKRPLTREESLLFDLPKRRPEVYAGSIADIKLPAFLEKDDGGAHRGSIHDEAVDYFAATYGEEEIYKPRHRRDIAPDVLEPLNAELLDELESELTDLDDPVWDSRVDWTRVADKAGLDEGERMVLQCKLDGESRDSVMARQRSPEKRQNVQAAWRRLDRKWHRIAEAIKRPPSTPPVAPAPTAASRSVVSAPEALRQLKERRGAEKNRLCFEPDSLPRYTDYAH
jgi:hypothetical protein